jgi:hypothetical protein
MYGKPHKNGEKKGIKQNAKPFIFPHFWNFPRFEFGRHPPKNISAECSSLSMRYITNSSSRRSIQQFLFIPQSPNPQNTMKLRQFPMTKIHIPCQSHSHSTPYSFLFTTTIKFPQHISSPHCGRRESSRSGQSCQPAGV